MKKYHDELSIKLYVISQEWEDEMSPSPLGSVTDALCDLALAPCKVLLAYWLSAELHIKALKNQVSSNAINLR